MELIIIFIILEDISSEISVKNPTAIDLIDTLDAKTINHNL